MHFNNPQFLAGAEVYNLERGWEHRESSRTFVRSAKRRMRHTTARALPRRSRATVQPCVAAASSDSRF